METEEIRKRRGGVKRERRGGEGEGRGVKRKGEEGGGKRGGLEWNRGEVRDRGRQERERRGEERRGKQRPETVSL